MSSHWTAPSSGFTAARLDSLLEHQFQCQLNNARSAGCDVSLSGAGIGQRLGDPAVVPVGQTGSRVVEHGVVEDVEEFSPELHADPLALDRDLLVSAHIPT